MSASALPPSWIFKFRFGRTLFQVFPFDCWTSKMGYCGDNRRNLVAITSASLDMTISASAAAILDFPLPVWSYSIPGVSIGLLDLENRGVAVEIVSLGGIEAEIRWGYFLPPTCNLRM